MATLFGTMLADQTGAAKLGEELDAVIEESSEKRLY